MFFIYNTLQKSFPVFNNKREFCTLGYSFDLFNLFCFCFCFSVLTAVVIVNESVEKKNSVKLTEELMNAGLTSVKESLCQRYLTKLISAKQEKAQVGYMTVFVLISNITSVNLLFIETTLLTAQETINEIIFDSRDNVFTI